jgi:transposase-like protein
VKVLAEIIKNTNKLSKNITLPKIEYGELLKELNKNVALIQHYVCHFCGVVFNYDEINKSC